MHFEFLIEDMSGKKFLDILLPKIIHPPHTFKVISYRGIGKIPTNLNAKGNPQARILLTQLPSLIRGYGKTYAGYGDSYDACVFVLCDLDNKNLSDFRDQLDAVLDNCTIKPTTYFCIAVEEGEAWLLGDLNAIRKAYPSAKDSILDAYTNDSICGTWEVLADAVYPGGATALKLKGWQAAGKEKSEWAEKITPHMSVCPNSSPSFKYFMSKLMPLLGG